MARKKNAKLNNIMKKSSWTGDEVGRLIFANATDGYIRVLKGESNPDPLFTQEELNNAIKTLTYHDGSYQYNRYINMYNWLLSQVSVAKVNYYIAESNLRSLVSNMANISIMERSLDHIHSQPVIMTRPEYEKAKAEAIEKKKTLFSEEPTSLFYLFDKALTYYTSLYYEHPRKKNPVKKILKAYDKETIETDVFNRLYGELMGDIIYILPNGKTREEASKEEWLDVLREGGLLAYNNAEDLKDPDGIRASFYIDNLIDEGLTKAESKDALEKIASGKGFKIEFKYKDKAPDDFSKLDMVSEGFSFSFMEITEDDTAKERKAYFIAFYNEFTELSKAILEDIDKTVNNGSTSYSETSIDELSEDLFSKSTIDYNELYDKNIYGIKDEVEKDPFSYFAEPTEQERQISNRGIAVIEEGYKKDEEAYTPPKYIQETDKTFGLASYDPINETGNSYNIQVNRENIISAYQELSLYDEFIKIIGKFLNMDDFKVYLAGVDEIKGRIEAYNNLLSMYRKSVISSVNVSADERDFKTRLFDENFYPIDLDSINVNDQTKKQFENDLYLTLLPFKDENKNPLLDYREGAFGNE